MRRLITGAALGVLTAAALAAGSVSAIPDDGNGGKFVGDLTETRGIDCDGDMADDLLFGVTGWFQAQIIGSDDDRVVAVTVFHADNVFTNAAGKTLVFKDRGPDVVYVDDGNLLVAVTGRTQVGNIGRVVLDLDNFEVEFRAGTAPFAGDVFDPDLIGYACQQLV